MYEHYSMGQGWICLATLNKMRSWFRKICYIPPNKSGFYLNTSLTPFFLLLPPFVTWFAFYPLLTLCLSPPLFFPASNLLSLSLTNSSRLAYNMGSEFKKKNPSLFTFIIWERTYIFDGFFTYITSSPSITKWWMDYANSTRQAQWSGLKYRIKCDVYGGSTRTREEFNERWRKKNKGRVKNRVEKGGGTNEEKSRVTVSVSKPRTKKTSSKTYHFATKRHFHKVVFHKKSL